MNIETWWTSIIDWCGGMFWNVETLYQGIVVGLAFTLSLIAHRFIKPKLTNFIQTSKLSYHIKRICMNLIKQVLPSIAFILIGITSIVFGPNALGLDTGILEGSIKLLAAWIVIRIALQFIENNFVRNIFAFSIWLFAALSIFEVLGPVAYTLDGIGFNIGEFRISALSVLKGILSVVILLYMADFLAGFFERRISNVRSLTRSSQVLISKVVRVLLIVTAILIAVTGAGIDLSLFAVFGGAIGLGIGFGLQKGISNLFSGMLLLMDRSIKPGDVIEIAETGTFGWVNHMAARYTEIVTRDNKSFLIPNEDFITQRVINWSHGDSLIRLQLEFGVHYDSDPHLVKKLAEEAAAKAWPERIVDQPSPVCWLVEFGDSSLNFSLRFWIKDAEAGVTNIKGTVMMALWDAFKENDIEIPFPTREIYMHEGKK